MQLDALQRSMIEAIDRGPDFIAEQAFAGGWPAALHGLSVHANTISHARLIALEESFARTRAWIGEERFNALSRDFASRPEAMRQPLAMIGASFSDFLERGGLSEAAVLAAFEWAWLESYHAADADALALSGLAGLDETSLLETRVALHPAARLSPPLPQGVLDDEVPGLSGTTAILVTRPGADVLVAPACPAMARLFTLSQSPQPICNLLEAGGEQASKDALQPLLRLIEAGALVRV